MSMIIHPTRTSALNMYWTEDFTRGYNGVAKNGGVITGTVPTLNGSRWAKFTAVARIDYPRHIGNNTAMTVGCWYKNLNLGATSGALLSSWYSTTLEYSYLLWISGMAGNLQVYFKINSADRSALIARSSIVELSTGNLLIGRWESGDYVELWFNGVRVAQSVGTYTGTVDPKPNPICLGNGNGAAYNWGFIGEMADPFIINRKLSDTEIVNMFNKGMLR